MKTPYGTGGPLLAPRTPDVTMALLALLKRQMDMNRELQTALLREVAARRLSLPAPRRRLYSDDELLDDTDLADFEDITPVRTRTVTPIPMPGPWDPATSSDCRSLLTPGLAIAAGISFTIAVALVPGSLVGAVVVAMLGGGLVLLAVKAAG